MSTEVQIQEALPDRSLTVSEAEALVDSSDDDPVWPVAIRADEAGDNEVLALLAETPETVYALGFDPERTVWVAFETWESTEGFDRGQTDETVREWVTSHHPDVVRDDIWNPSA
ncbi:hypothetical protein JCM30237_06200 [Halolamina litorea]|uniref:DUF7964 domain-containing protein n=1 Tax=Halolamina litorea TaxID=1515593 RepID=A0ABD6BR13_9EURY|nr:hypothetical protein [Halolamina litorea]